ncbi:unnamed protein product [Xylocopa violacea]|uniref:Copper transport protein n=1 Tax=Xylocopa violacea TaxID=135666 RepID=A0ABP1P3K1_XYLVO
MSHDHTAHMMNTSGGHGVHDAHASHHGMDHSNMHATMPSSMDHTGMDHGGMDHSSMDHSGHSVPSTGDACANMGMHGMSMVFHGGYCENVLFSSWKVTSVSGLIGSMIGIMIMAALYEGLKYYREYLFWKMYNSLQYRSVTMPQEKNVVAEDNRVVQPTMLSWMHTFQTFLHIVQIVLSYFLMLIFMTYNVWLCFAVVFGAAIGYFLFGWKKSVIVDVTEHCH